MSLVRKEIKISVLIPPPPESKNKSYEWFKSWKEHIVEVNVCQNGYFEVPITSLPPYLHHLVIKPKETLRELRKHIDERIQEWSKRYALGSVEDVIAVINTYHEVRLLKVTSSSGHESFTYKVTSSSGNGSFTYKDTSHAFNYYNVKDSVVIIPVGGMKERQYKKLKEQYLKDAEDLIDRYSIELQKLK